MVYYVNKLILYRACYISSIQVLTVALIKVQKNKECLQFIWLICLYFIMGSIALASDPKLPHTEFRAG